MAMVKSQLFTYWRQQEIARGKPIEVSDVVQFINEQRTARGETKKISPDTVKNLVNDDTGRFDSPIIGDICAFFEVPEGAPVPFLVVTYREAGKTTKPTS